MAKFDVQIKDYPSLFSLEGKVAVVTGGSRGLGLHAASAFMQAGCSKVYITSRKAQGCEEAVDLLNKLPGKREGAEAISIPADGSKISEIERLVKEVSKTTDHVDILFANAGATWGAPFEDHTDQSFSKVMDLNVKSVFFFVQKFLPLLQKNATKENPSKVIATASVAGILIGSTGKNSVPAYSASKAGVINLIRHLAVDLGPKHILSNAIAPGFFPSRMANGLMDALGGVEALEKQSPDGNIGKPEDIAGACVYLASRASGHVNGATIQIDGGTGWSRAQL